MVNSSVHGWLMWPNVNTLLCDMRRRATTYASREENLTIISLTATAALAVAAVAATLAARRADRLGSDMVEVGST